jgi:Spy/CpxP family protein refolding chaperone
MRYVTLMLAAAMVMATMLVASALPAMASNGESASGGKVCNAPGIAHAHATIPEKNETAHSNVPCETD